MPELDSNKAKYWNKHIMTNAQIKESKNNYLIEVLQKVITYYEKNRKKLIAIFKFKTWNLIERGID